MVSFTLGVKRSLNFDSYVTELKIFSGNKLGCVFPMVIFLAFRMGEYRVNDHGERFNFTRRSRKDEDSPLVKLKRSPLFQSVSLLE